MISEDGPTTLLNNEQHIIEHTLAGLKCLDDIQSIVSKNDPACMPPNDEPPTKDQIRTYTLALTVEVSEFVQTLNWKPWKADKDIDRERVIDEFADILAFLGIIIAYLRRMGITPRDLARGYFKKSAVNYARLTGGVAGYILPHHNKEAKNG